MYQGLLDNLHCRLCSPQKLAMELQRYVSTTETCLVSTNRRPNARSIITYQLLKAGLIPSCLSTPTNHLFRLFDILTIHPAMGMLQEALSSVVRYLMVRLGFRKDYTVSSFGEGGEETSSSNSSARLFALLIGINNYSYHDCSNSTFSPQAATSQQKSNSSERVILEDLHGAVADAEHFRDYLVDDLKVPTSHIKLLIDKDATRNNIITAFQNLARDTNIQNGDSIFIFYAGHGAQAYAPKRLLNVPGCPKHVEVLIPFDYNENPSNSKNMAIPDYTLEALLNNIAKNKGDNITIVFDCCHSASALRAVKGQATLEKEFTLDEDKVRIRSGPELRYNIPDNLDVNIWGPRKRGMTTPPDVKHFGTSSYVFLAACNTSEWAQEKGNRGCFSAALLDYLKEDPQSALKATCSEVMSHLKIEGQNPQCEGQQSDKRSIFHNYTPPYRKHFFDFRVEPKNGSIPSFILKGGEAHGLSANDELFVYANKLQAEDQPIATIVLKEVSIDKSSFEFTTDTHITLSDYPQAAAVLYRPAITVDESQYLAVYVDPRGLELAKRVRDIGGSVLVKTMDRAHIHLSSAPNSQLCFQVVDAALVNVQLKPHFTPDTEADLTHVLSRLSHYYHHLKRNSTSLLTDDTSLPADDTRLSTSNISISMFRLKDNGHGHPRVVRTDDSTNLVSKVTHAADIVVRDNDETIYGLEIKNDSNQQNQQHKLYPVLLYFDNVDFTIKRSFPHTVSLERETDSPWPANGGLVTIGYGVGPGSSINPFSFYVDKGHEVEAGFFKLFLFDTPVDLQNVEQDASPFVKMRGMKSDPLPNVEPSKSRWGAITFSVIQRRG